MIYDCILLVLYFGLLHFQTENYRFFNGFAVLNVLGRYPKLWELNRFVEELKTTLENRKASSDFIRFLLGILSSKSDHKVFDKR